MDKSAYAARRNDWLLNRRARAERRLAEASPCGLARFGIYMGLSEPQAKRLSKCLKRETPMPKGLWSVILLGTLLLFVGAAVMGWAMG